MSHRECGGRIRPSTAHSESDSRGNRTATRLISGGENVYAAEVEAVFAAHEAVAECALIPQPDEKWGEVGLMVTVLKPDAAVTEADLKAFCEGKLARYKIPKRVIFVDELPHSPYGKVEKVKLRERYGKRDA
ncbi:MAG: hypothetical protein ACE5FD_04720 [Anaerolineae bacterium]